MLEVVRRQEAAKDIAWDSWEKTKDYPGSNQENGFDTVKGIYTVIVEEEMV